MSEFDVAIIGAGAAGLGAARSLIAAGKTVVVLEAGDRAGGRAWTSEDWFGVPFDIGCALGSCGAATPFFPRRGRGVGPYYSRMFARASLFRGAQGDLEEMDGVREAEAAALGACLEAMRRTTGVSSLISNCHWPAGAFDLLGRWTSASTTRFPSRTTGGGRPTSEPNSSRQGYGRLSAALAGDLPVRLNHAVRRDSTGFSGGGGANLSATGDGCTRGPASAPSRPPCWL